MTYTLVCKLLRDVRLALVVVAFVLGGFQVFWYKTTDRILGDLSPFFTMLASLGGMSREDIEARLFQGGPAQIAKTIIGGDRLSFDSAMDLLSVGYVHPIIVITFCIWSVGRAAGAIAGELDRGTMELLLAQPLARFRIILAHFFVDLITIPLLCLSLWGGNWLAYQTIGPIQERPVKLPEKAGPMALMAAREPSEEAKAVARKRLEVRLLDFAPALLVVGGLMFAVSGYTMTISALGRFRLRVLGVAVFLTLIQFLINVLGQLWDGIEALRPLTIFYYYQPQQVILGHGWTVPVWGVRVPFLAVLFGVGLSGYGLALWIFSRRDLPAPL
jgi:ABC-2 type transport system permease protein